MKKLWEEFIAFINKGNALALAIGVIIGGAFTTIVSTINAKIISPLIGTFIGGRDLSNSLVYVLTYKTDAAGNFVLDEAGHKIIENAIYWGAFLQAVIDFLLTALILFSIFKIATSISAAAKRAAERVKNVINPEEQEEVVEEEPAPEEIPADIQLLTEIRDLLAGKAPNDEETTEEETLDNQE